MKKINIKNVISPFVILGISVLVWFAPTFFSTIHLNWFSSTEIPIDFSSIRTILFIAVLTFLSITLFYEKTPTLYKNILKGLVFIICGLFVYCFVTEIIYNLIFIAINNGFAPSLSAQTQNYITSFKQYTALITIFSIIISAINIFSYICIFKIGLVLSKKFDKIILKPTKNSLVFIIVIFLCSSVIAILKYFSTMVDVNQVLLISKVFWQNGISRYYDFTNTLSIVFVFATIILTGYFSIKKDKGVAILCEQKSTRKV